MNELLKVAKCYFQDRLNYFLLPSVTVSATGNNLNLVSRLHLHAPEENHLGIYKDIHIRWMTNFTYKKTRSSWLQSAAQWDSP